MFLKLPFYNPKTTIKDLVKSFFLKDVQKKLVSFLQNYFKKENIVLLKSARQGIKLALEFLKLEKGEEVITSSFICSVVPEAVVRAGGKPVFCDIEKNGFNMDIKSTRKLVSPRTRAIILSYVFGIPAPVDEFLSLCKEKNLILIEDCAQSFGAKYKNKLLGTFGEFSVFSFGISKNIGGLGGGFLISKKKQTKTLKPAPFSFKKQLEFLLIPLVFNKYFYWIFSSFVEKYGDMRRVKGNDKEFVSSILKQEVKIAFLQLKRYKKNMQLRNKNTIIYQQDLKDVFSFIKVLEGGFPAYPYFPVFAPQKIFNILKSKNVPVRRIGFGELDKDAKFGSFNFLNFNEKKIQSNYFLLPLNHSSKEVRNICRKIKQIVKKC
ncbi:MAG: aminotransferase class V-fold PLP-dependent enzyme [Candidatus Nealsonbacteria bacterium]